MADDIDRILASAQIRSKFAGALDEFNELLTLVDRYVDAEEVKVDSSKDIDEDEITALEMMTVDIGKVEEDLKRVKELIQGGLG